ncbi:transglutaminase-like cysteine peptidase [Sphingomonas sp. NSE70-1]|uniref:Transglutaminase-like cysteine peptidase n=1 Tax=Sphingomonas caseinilyticus TaxID=2908205 RepID=A0ABT0RV50_9SPHN|nr:transglutaminase-like cysteine peptidase [Sphingomonas caseinilyticus]
MAKQLIGAAIVGACLAAATPAWADSVEAAATPTTASASDKYSPVVINKRGMQLRKSSRPLSLDAPSSPDVFGTVALNAGVTFYDARFRRVASTDNKDPLVLSLAQAAVGLDPVAKLQMVQQEVNQRVRWMHDLDNMGVADFWANAGETLRRGSGDSEDIAIAKMQVLKAAGFSPKDLYISIGKHNVRGAHVILLARAAGRFYVLDDTLQNITTPAEHARFTPVMTLGQGASWIHGKRVAGPRVASTSGTTKTAAK